MTKCNSCNGSGGMIVNEDFSLDFETCMKCDGYGLIYGDANETELPKVQKGAKDRRRS